MRLLLYSVLPESGHLKTCGKGPFSAHSRHHQIHLDFQLHGFVKVIT